MRGERPDSLLEVLVHSIFMQEFSQTLLVARRQAGLSQTDCAHLLGVSRSHISRLECGKTIPNVADLCGVALLFGRTMEGLSGTLFNARARELKDRLFDLPEPRKKWLGHFNRNNTLDRLGERIDRIIDLYGS